MICPICSTDCGYSVSGWNICILENPEVKMHPTTTGRMITQQELVDGMWAMDYQTMKYQPTMRCICNNKNCRYQHDLPVSWTWRIESKDVRCFECNRSFFNIKEVKV